MNRVGCSWIRGMVASRAEINYSDSVAGSLQSLGANIACEGDRAKFKTGNDSDVIFYEMGTKYYTKENYDIVCLQGV